MLDERRRQANVLCKWRMLSASDWMVIVAVTVARAVGLSCFVSTSAGVREHGEESELGTKHFKFLGKKIPKE